MRAKGGIAMVLAMAWGGIAHAECPAPSYGSGTVHILSPLNKNDVDLILSMSMMPKMLKITYARERAAEVPCKLTTFKTSASEYELRAAPDGLANARIAFPSIKGDAIAELVPVTNIIAAIEASKQGKAAPLSGYMLLTLTKTTLTGWQLYDGVPNVQMLVADMTAALSASGSLHPVFTTDTATGKNSIFVPVQ